MGTPPSPTRPRRRRRPWRLGAAAALAVVALLLLAQLALPPLAERHVRDRLGQRGEVASVDVRAVPAVALLWRHADRVGARVRGYDAAGLDLVGELTSARGVGQLDVRLERVRLDGGLTLHDVRVRKHGDAVDGTALVDGDALAAALPVGGLRLVDGGGGGIELAGEVAGVPTRVRVAARGGDVVVRPAGVLGALAAAAVFSDPRLAVEHVAARPLADGRWVLSARARLR